MESGFIALLDSWITAANGILWGNLMTYLLLGTGVLYTLALRFPQIRGFKHMWSVVLGGRKSNEGGITSFQALCTSLAAQVGTGNIAGVATALVSGGPGAVFWMWVTALIGMATIFGEAVLAQVYRVKNDDGTYRGGPAYYLEKGLGQKWMAVLFAISIIIAMAFIFNAVQSNSIAAGLRGAWDFDPRYVAVGTIIMTAIVIFGGLRRIARVAEFVVPFMALLFIAASLYVTLINISQLPAVFGLIFEHAFGPRQVAGGVAGYTIAKAFRFGVARGLFSNEAGMGSTPVANATADVRHPARQGYSAMMGVFVDTVVICSCTALIILLSGQLESGKTGVELTQVAISSELGGFGIKFIGIALMFFAWTSILGNYYYGESNLVYIFPNCTKPGMTIYRLIVLGFLYFGATTDVPVVWNLADFFNGIMAMLNLIGIILLTGIVVKVARDYDRKLAAGDLNPSIDRSLIKTTTVNIELPEA